MIDFNINDIIMQAGIPTPTGVGTNSAPMVTVKLPSSGLQAKRAALAGENVNNVLEWFFQKNGLNGNSSLIQTNRMPVPMDYVQFKTSQYNENLDGGYVHTVTISPKDNTSNE